MEQIGRAVVHSRRADVAHKGVVRDEPVVAVGVELNSEAGVEGKRGAVECGIGRAPGLDPTGSVVDGGGVWVDMGSVNSRGIKSGGGIGLRLLIPIGPIRLDYGYGINRGAGRVYFTGGWNF